MAKSYCQWRLEVNYMRVTPLPVEIKLQLLEKEIRHC
jgi:hypothetical protein